jgi:hypothetical protein
LKRELGIDVDGEPLVDKPKGMWVHTYGSLLDDKPKSRRTKVKPICSNAGQERWFVTDQTADLLMECKTTHVEQ